MRRLKKTLIALSLSSFYCTSFAATHDAFAELDQATANAKRSPEEIKQEFHDYVNRRFDEYEAWRENYTRELDQQRQALINQWGSAQISDQTTDVQYSADDSVRQVVDYENNTATVSVLVDASVSNATAQQLATQQLNLPEGTVADLNQAQVSEHAVNYSREQENQEKDFVLAQTRAQMNEYDIQAERLIAADTGAPDDFIYQRAYQKKMALIDEAKQRIELISNQYRQQRKALGIPEPLPADPIHAAQPVDQTPASNEVATVTERQAEPTPAVVPSKAKPAPVEPVVAKVPVTTAPTAEHQAAQPVASSTSSDQPAATVTEPVATPAAEKATTHTAAAPKKVISYKISLPNNSLAKRASHYQPLALEESEKWSVDPALVMAIMHSESAFRPEAKSYVPAFGLMQIVPTTAGHDVNRQMRKIDAPMKESELYQPPVNVETGTAYLHILQSKYLKRIEDKQSRLYCTIAAYNTGAGNVARAFNADRSTNIRKAAGEINQLTPDQVYQTLMNNLPYDETKTYLKKVSSRLALYQPETTQ
ncbi:transglycosylase SLT domain-containing protein [Vibrio furnissii]|uniref:transglycosylase SLT domain-containing protein n=1 Tax=Vibrio furnissii TaxID=29494 RepID=UPI0023DC9202|nr:transglycosylase SLT domain-containing protein [Vibrio furnissii]